MNKEELKEQEKAKRKNIIFSIIGGIFKAIGSIISALFRGFDSMNGF